MKCLNCEDNVKRLHEDPNDAPIEIGDCICLECRGNFLFDVIEDLKQQVDDLTDIYIAEGHTGVTR